MRFPALNENGVCIFDYSLVDFLGNVKQRSNLDRKREKGTPT